MYVEMDVGICGVNLTDSNAAFVHFLSKKGVQ